MQYAGASKGAISTHYDQDTNFWPLWLDQSMTYSCAVWAPGDNLESAQDRKLDFYLEQTKARGCEALLDVGCGWGSMLRRAVDNFGVQRAVGLTLSESQRRWIERRPDDRIECRFEGWADHPSNERYDAIISLGAFEHFAAIGLSKRKKVQAYRDFFERCRSWLAPGGWLGLQTIVKGNRALGIEDARDVAWLYRFIYPESEIPRIAEIEAAADGLFRVELLRNEPEHYVRTLAEWRVRFDIHLPAIRAAVGDELAERYMRYLEVSQRFFEQDICGLARLVLQRI